MTEPKPDEPLPDAMKMSREEFKEGLRAIERANAKRLAELRDKRDLEALSLKYPDPKKAA